VKTRRRGAKRQNRKKSKARPGMGAPIASADPELDHLPP
jgi:hypothetical protein